MNDFSLTGPRIDIKGGAHRDPHVFAYRDTIVPEDRALTAWLDAQLSSCDLDDLDAELRDISQRLETARAWFSEHGGTHPRYLDADRRRRRLEDRQRDLLMQFRVASYGCWIHVLTTYAALQHVPDAPAWIAEHASPGGQPRFSGQTPHGIWQALRGMQPAPGAWPVENREAWIERRVSALEVWNAGWMQNRLAERLENPR